MNSFSYTMQIDLEMLQNILSECVEYIAVAAFDCNINTLNIIAYREKWMIYESY